MTMVHPAFTGEVARQRTQARLASADRRVFVFHTRKPRY